MAKKKKSIIPRDVKKMGDGTVGIFCDSLAFFADLDDGRFEPFAADIVSGGMRSEVSDEEMGRLWNQVDKTVAKRLLFR